MYDRKKVSEMGDTEAPQDENQAGQEESSEIKPSTVTIFLVGAPVAIVLIYLSTRYCIFAKLRGFCKKQEEETLFNRVYLFFDGSLLILLVSSTITVY